MRDRAARDHRLVRVRHRGALEILLLRGHLGEQLRPDEVARLGADQLLEPLDDPGRDQASDPPSVDREHPEAVVGHGQTLSRDALAVMPRRLSLALSGRGAAW